MTAFVCNTLTGAVSEYSRHAFQSVTDRYAGNASGLYEYSGDTDAGQPIACKLQLPLALRASTLKKSIAMMYLSMHGQGAAELAILGFGGKQWDYVFPLRDTGQTRCIVGKGIRENYLGLVISTPNGQDFTLDRVEVMGVESKNRRV